jgi:N-acetylneuraminic acid mutarotase
MRLSSAKSDEEKEKIELDPNADHAYVQDQMKPKFGTPFVGDELWSYNYDTKKWTLIKKKIKFGNSYPQPRWLHSAVVMDGKMLIFGGVNPDSVILGDVWIYNPDDNTWMEAKVEGVPILPREGHSAVTVGNTMIVFGGISYAYSPFDDVWTYLSAENRWERNKIQGSKPAPRWMHTAVLHTASGGKRSMWVFGGMTHQYVPLNDLWKLNIESMSWEHPEITGFAPFPRMLHVAVIIEDSMFIHGGSANNLLLEDFHKYDAKTNTWTEMLPSTATPVARAGHTMVSVTPPMNPNPNTDNRPPWHPPDPSLPAPRRDPPFPLRPRKEYSGNRWFYIFGGCRNEPLSARLDYNPSTSPFSRTTANKPKPK